MGSQARMGVCASVGFRTRMNSGASLEAHATTRSHCCASKPTLRDVRPTHDLCLTDLQSVLISILHSQFILYNIIEQVNH